MLRSKRLFLYKIITRTGRTEQKRRRIGDYDNITRNAVARNTRRLQNIVTREKQKWYDLQNYLPVGRAQFLAVLPKLIRTFSRLPIYFWADRQT